jgi:hypothetical protein
MVLAAVSLMKVPRMLPWGDGEVKMSRLHTAE